MRYMDNTWRRTKNNATCVFFEHSCSLELNNKIRCFDMQILGGGGGEDFVIG